MNQIDPKKFYNEVMPNKQGEDYETARWHNNPVASVGYDQTKESIQKCLPNNITTSNILEVGPGAGTWTKLLLDKYPQAKLTLLDISSEMLSRAKAAVGENNIDYIESDFGTWDSGANKFDLFFSSRMLEYMEDKDLFVQKIKSILKPGAAAIITTKYPHYLRQKMQGKKISSLHTGQIKPSDLKKIFEANGFKIKKVRAVTVVVPLFKSAKLNKIFGKLVQNIPLNPITNSFVESYVIRVELL